MRSPQASALRVFAIPDIHIDYEENRSWLLNLSKYDCKNDVLILAGDVSDNTPLLIEAFMELRQRFSEVFFVPGNHDLWACRDKQKNSLEKFETIVVMADDYGIRMTPAQFGSFSIVPLLGWYDYSFGQPSDELKNIWNDYRACKWPDNFDEQRITRFFISKNNAYLDMNAPCIMSFSHFLPRIDIMPSYIPFDKRILYPALGTSLLEEQIRNLGSHIHIYGHSHVNLHVQKNGITYINNAFGYPQEQVMAKKELVCIFDNDG